MAITGWYDYFVVVAAAFGLAAWGTFAIGFGLETENTSRLSGDGLWDSPILRCDWYFFSVFGILACVFEIFYGLTKRSWILALIMVLGCIALVSSGGALASTGRFLYNCNQEDENGQTRQGPGCQEETYDNYALVFVGCFIFLLSQAIAFIASVFASEESKFSFHNPRRSTFQLQVDQTPLEATKSV